MHGVRECCPLRCGEGIPAKDPVCSPGEAERMDLDHTDSDGSLAQGRLSMTLTQPRLLPQSFLERRRSLPVLVQHPQRPAR